MTNTASLPSVQGPAKAHGLRNLYFIRAAFSAFWVATMLLAGVPAPGIGAWLLVIYPAWDVVATLIELRLQANPRVQVAQYLNVAGSVLATIAFGVVLHRTLPTQITVFGIWALVAGLLQLFVGLARRRQLRGQWAIIASGAQSSVAGVAFILMANTPSMGLHSLAGYSAVGAVYFLVAAIRLALRSRQQE
ncbi:MAG TPA: hypothetical protein VD886_11110 [Herpetosiphonaceae bacterium]|nr:hypothetical protein [Herpetosiphonaceae bacterium]